MTSSLETEFSNRKRPKTSAIRVETMLLNEQIEQCHGKCQSSFEIRPDPMSQVFEMIAHGFHQHPGISFTAMTDLEIGVRPVLFDKMPISKDQHRIYHTIDRV